MDNLNVQFYKDKDDIIVVFKNASKEVEDIVKSLLTGMAGEKVEDRIVPALTPPPEVELKQPENFETYEKLLPSFLDDDDIGSNVYEDITEDAVIEEKILETAVEKPTDYFLSGKYRDMTPAGAVETYGYLAFYDLCAMVFSNDFSSDMLKEATIKTVKEYFTANEKELVNLRTIKFKELEQILLSAYPIAEDIVNLEVSKKSYSDVTSYLNVENEYNLRGLVWKVVNCVTKFVKQI